LQMDDNAITSMTRVLKIFSLLFLLWFATHVSVITCDGLNDDLGGADIGIVLGNKVENDGRPSNRLKSRLDRAYELYTGKYIKLLVVSGGVDPGGFNEAEVMKNYLIAKGVPGSGIIMDLQGANTIKTAINTKELLRKHNYKSVMIITQYYHISRTRLAFAKAGIGNVYSAHARIFEFRDLYSLFREFFAYYKYLLCMWGMPTGP
jgi:vancomycin permeability regulator SanA